MPSLQSQRLTTTPKAIVGRCIRFSAVPFGLLKCRTHQKVIRERFRWYQRAIRLREVAVIVELIQTPGDTHEGRSDRYTDPIESKDVTETRRG